MTIVAVVADLPSTGCVPGATALRLPLGSGQGYLTKEQFFEATGELLEREKTVVCVYPTWQGGRAKHVVNLTRSLLSTERVVAVPSNLPPLALSLMVDLLAHVANHVPPGLVIAMVDRLATMLAAGAWLRSVTKFQHATIPFSFHMRSYLPGAAFVASIAPEPQVSKATSPNAIPWRPPEPVQVIVTPTDGDETWVRGQLSAVMRPTVVRALQPLPVMHEYWGAKQLVEFVAFSTHPNALTNAVRSVRYRPCSWCNELVTSDPCPFCQMSATGATFQPSHTLPDSQRLPTLVTATGNGGRVADAQLESDKR